jgi:putative hydrolase of the HAD superfamily
MPLLMLDLDDTLVDRDAAFRQATAAFLAEHALPESDLEWLMSVDASGYTPRPAVARALADRYGASLPESRGVGHRRLTPARHCRCART